MKVVKSRKIIIETTYTWKDFSIIKRINGKLQSKYIFLKIKKLVHFLYFFFICYFLFITLHENHLLF